MKIVFRSHCKRHITFAMLAISIMLCVACNKEILPFSLQITNPFDVDVLITGNNVQGCPHIASSLRYESIDSDCILSPKEVKTFLVGESGYYAKKPSDEISSVEIGVVEHSTIEDWEPKMIGRTFFKGYHGGENYKWQIGFNNPVYDSHGNNVLESTDSGDGGNNGGGNGGGSNNGQVIFWRSKEKAAFYSDCGPGADVKVFYREEFGTKRTTKFYNTGEVTCNTTVGVARFSLAPGEYYYSLSNVECTGGIAPLGPFKISAGECLIIELPK